MHSPQQLSLRLRACPPQASSVAPSCMAMPPSGTRAAVEVAPRAVWATLTPALQAGVRRTALRILQEVSHDTC